MNIRDVEHQCSENGRQMIHQVMIMPFVHNILVLRTKFTPLVHAVTGTVFSTCGHMYKGVISSANMHIACQQSQLSWDMTEMKNSKKLPVWTLWWWVTGPSFLKGSIFLPIQIFYFTVMPVNLSVVHTFFLCNHLIISLIINALSHSAQFEMQGLCRKQHIQTRV